MPTIADGVKNVMETGKMNLQNWKNAVRGSAKSAGLGNGQGPFGFGILGGSRAGTPLNIRQKVGDMIAGRGGGMRLAGTRVFVEGSEVSAGSARTYDEPILP